MPLNHDPVRAKLESVREGLLARESELLAMGMEGMSMGSNVKVKEEPMSMDMEVKVEPGAGTGRGLGSSPITPSGVRRGSGPLGNGTSGGRSGKQRALDLIRQGESGLAPGAILLYVFPLTVSERHLTSRPIEQTLSLGNRDYTTQTLDQFNHLSLAKPKQKTYDPLDENARAQALARMNNFMSYKGDGDGDGEGDDDEGGDIFGFDDGEYEGEDDRMGTGGTRARGTGERVDEYGEDEEIWREGADDEYTLGGGNLDQT